MPSDLQVYDARERRLVAVADRLLAPLHLRRWLGRTRRDAVRRILLMRLERIGDLVMVVEAIRTARDVWPDADLDLAVGSWNKSLADLLPVTRVLVADAPWLARDDGRASWRHLLRTARAWRSPRYDLVINFEPDIRSNLLARLTGARRRVGYWTGGGGALLTDAMPYDPTTHVGVQALQLVARAAGVSVSADLPTIDRPAFVPPEDARARADAVLAGRSAPFIGVHASGGRASKQWHLDRFADVARALIATHGGTIVLTGAAGDRPFVDAVRARLDGIPVVDASGALEVPALAALLARLDVFVTGDTGPMHLAAAMATPVVALFGPSDPRRYGPLGTQLRVLRIDLPCSPCGQVRLPPERCRGHVPDCLDGIASGVVVRAASELLAERVSRAAPAV